MIALDKKLNVKIYRMKKLFIPVGMLYVIIGMLIATDLNPFLYWGWYQNNVNTLINTMISIHPGVIYLWIISMFIVAHILKKILDEKYPSK